MTDEELAAIKARCEALPNALAAADALAAFLDEHHEVIHMHVSHTLHCTGEGCKIRELLRRYTEGANAAPRATITHDGLATIHPAPAEVERLRAALAAADAFAAAWDARVDAEEDWDCGKGPLDEDERERVYHAALEAEGDARIRFGQALR